MFLFKKNPWNCQDSNKFGRDYENIFKLKLCKIISEKINILWKTVMQVFTKWYDLLEQIVLNQIKLFLSFYLKRNDNLLRKAAKIAGVVLGLLYE